MALWYLGDNHTADCVLIAHSTEGLKIALIERKSEPFKGCYAFPGGFVDTEAKPGEPFKLGLESPDTAALRELKEETGVALSTGKVLRMERIGFYDDPERDPRNTDQARVVSTAFLVQISKPLPLSAADDAARAEWIDLERVVSGEVRLAFDHRQILSDAIQMDLVPSYSP